jgi:dephospho-CoA kinase
MKEIGVTGGIGSGKSFVCKILEKMGYPVYYSDDRAKTLMNSDLTVQSELKLLLGDEAYTEDGLNRAFVSNKLFSDTSLRKKINQLIHPIVREDFEQWKKDFIREKFIFNEAAILFETGAHLNYDAVILVHAPIDIKLKRIKKRDGISEEDVLKKMKSQWSDDKKMQLTMHHILNDGESLIEERISLLLKQLSKPI